MAAYKRILLKLSGEALMGEDAYGINRATIVRIVREVQEVTHLGCESRLQFSSLEYVAPHKIPVYGVGVEEVLQSYRVTQILNTTNAGTTYTAPEYTEVVVDVANSPSFEDKAVLDFFETSGRNLLAV